MKWYGALVFVWGDSGIPFKVEVTRDYVWDDRSGAMLQSMLTMSSHCWTPTPGIKFFPCPVPVDRWKKRSV